MTYQSPLFRAGRLFRLKPRIRSVQAQGVPGLAHTLLILSDKPVQDHTEQTRPGVYWLCLSEDGQVRPIHHMILLDFYDYEGV